jgi:hypothetical protein
MRIDLFPNRRMTQFIDQAKMTIVPIIGRTRLWIKDKSVALTKIGLRGMNKNPRIAYAKSSKTIFMKYMG